MALLARLGAIRDGRLTDIGVAMHRLPIHPRLARMLVESGGSRDVALACAVLSERHLTVRATAASSSDLLSAIDDPGRLPPHVVDVARRLARDEEDRSAATPSSERERRFRRSIFCGYPDRVGRRRSPALPRYLLASGHGATLGRESSVHDAEFIVAVDVQAGRRGDLSEAIIRIASAVDAEWLEPTAVRIVHVLDSRGQVRAIERIFYDEIPLGERPAAIDPEEASRLLAAAFLRIPVAGTPTSNCSCAYGSQGWPPTLPRWPDVPRPAGRHCRRYRSFMLSTGARRRIWTALRRSRSVYQADARRRCSTKRTARSSPR